MAPPHFRSRARWIPQRSAGRRERAPVEGVVDSDIPIQSTDRNSRLGDLHLAFVMGKEVAKEPAQWWQLNMKGKIDTHMADGRRYLIPGCRRVGIWRMAD